MKAYIAISDNPNRAKFFTEEARCYIESIADVKWPSAKQVTTESVAREIDPDTDVYVTLWGSPRLDREILKAAPGIKLLLHVAGTVVPFVSDAMWERGIRVINGNDHMARSVAEGCIAYMQAALRKIPDYLNGFKSETLDSAVEPTSGLLGKTVGFVSFGAVAKHLVRMLRVFRCQIKVYDIQPIPEEYLALGCVPASLEEIFSESDVITLQTAYNEKTHHMIGRELLSLIRPGALLLNTARGGIIDEAALIEELRKRRFTAFLDVYENEPPSPDNELFDLPNVYMTPHMAGANAHLYPQRIRELFDEAKAFVDQGTTVLPHEVLRKKTLFMTLK